MLETDVDMVQGSKCSLRHHHSFKEDFQRSRSYVLACSGYHLGKKTTFTLLRLLLFQVFPKIVLEIVGIERAEQHPTLP